MMQAMFPAEDLRPHINVLASIANPKAALPVLRCIAVKGEGDYLYLSASDLEVFATAKVWRDKMRGEGGLCVPAKLLSDLLAVAGDAMMDAELTATAMRLRWGTHDSRLAGIPYEEFPQHTLGDAKQVYTISCDYLIQLIERTAYAASRDITRPMLTGVYIEQEGEGLRMTAADGYRLARVRRPLISAAEAMPILVPAKSLQRVAAILNQFWGGQVQLWLDERMIHFTWEHTQGQFLVSCLTLSEKYPNIESILAEEWPHRVYMPHEELMRGLRMAMIYARDAAQGERSDAYLLRVSVEPERMVLRTASERGDIEAVLSCTADTSMVFGVDIRYLKDALDHIDYDAIEIGLINPSSPLRVQPQGGGNHVAVIMPMQLPAMGE